jgi:hypothetical protein
MVGSKEGEGRAGKLLKERCDEAGASRHNDDTPTSSHSRTKLWTRHGNLPSQGAVSRLMCLGNFLLRRLRLVFIIREGHVARHFVALSNDVILNKKNLAIERI